MSFLASLRAQQSPIEQPLKLFYRLSVKPLSHTNIVMLPIVQLTLWVADDANAEDAKAYTPQATHLTLPPPFLTDADKAVLQYLITDTLNNGWPKIEAKFLTTLMNTGRVIFKPPVGLAKSVLLAEPEYSTLLWQSLNNGQQQLAPCKKSGEQFFATYNDLNLVTLKPASQKANTMQLCFSVLCFDQQPINDSQITVLQKTLQDNHYAVSAADIPEFLAQYQALFNEHNIPLPKLVSSQPLSAQVRGAIVCDQLNGVDEVHLEFVYISEQYCTWFRPDDPTHLVFLNNQLCHIARKPDMEASFYERFKKVIKSFVYNKQTDAYSAQKDNVWQSFFIQEKFKLQKEGFIFRFNQTFTKHYIPVEHFLSELKQKQDGSIQVDLFLEVINQYDEGTSKINLLSLLDQIHQYNLSHHQGDMTLKLHDGRWLLMSSQHLAKLTDEFSDLIFSGRQSLTFHPYQKARLMQLEACLPLDNIWLGDCDVLEASRKLQQVPEIIEQADCGIKATLRPYQWLGVYWMQHLKNCGVNGLLADDMGLGKTLQTISHLSLERAKNPQAQPALVVVPTSLLHNWLHECQKFAPHLSIFIYHGNQRKTKLANCIAANNPPHIILTSYQLVVNDGEYFKQTNFSWLVLDEAQNIKNPRTKTHMALKNIQAEHKLCLSGTPIENNLQELWALMNFLMPMCLGGLNDFKFHYQKPIEQEGNTKKLEQLLKRVEPFMLRRTKQLVAQDLPEKTEILQTIDLSEEQYRFYESIKHNTWQELQQNLEGTDNQGEQQLFVLSALLKLRQACCDPALLGEYDVPSAKRQQCIQMATELVAEGRAILIFSQFTSMLELLAEDLTQANIPYRLLTGKTTRRQLLVDQFQAGEFPVFLISLKAGGVGLNLTRADTVIHYDPWWNSAAEQQATDRAHRIGQKNAVFVYKLIAENTIEEKIAALQARKAELGNVINEQAQQTGAQFSLKLEELLTLLADE